MTKYILLYKGKATDMSEMTEEQQQAVMAGWKVWMDKVGSALVDIGSPMIPGKSIVDDGTTRDAIDMSGYSIIEASSRDDAMGLVTGHPFLSEGKGNYSVEVFELAPAPM